MVVISERSWDWNLSIVNLGWELEHVGDRDIWRRVSLAEWWAVEWAVGGESGTVMDPVAKLWDGDPLGWVDLKDPAQNQVQFGRQWKNGPEETGILQESSESAIALRSTLPWVSSTCEVDKDDTKGPDIIWSRSITSRSSRWRLLALR